MSNKGCLCSLLKSRKSVMWWQRKHREEPRRDDYAEFILIGSSDENNALFRGKFYSGGSIYNIERGEVKGKNFTFQTEAFDRPGATGQDSRIIGEGTCGPNGNLGSFRYTGPGKLYEYDFFIESPEGCE